MGIPDIDDFRGAWWNDSDNCRNPGPVDFISYSKALETYAIKTLQENIRLRKEMDLLKPQSNKPLNPTSEDLAG